MVIRMGTTLSQAVAQTVREAMVTADLSELALSETTAIPRVTLRRRLRGSPFTTDELERVALALDTTMSALVSQAEASAA